jgi:oligoribonuclease
VVWLLCGVWDMTGGMRPSFEGHNEDRAPSVPWKATRAGRLGLSRWPRVGRVNDRLVWIDCEMTGLSLETDALVEVAALVTDYELNVLGQGVDLVIKPPAQALEQMNEVVTRMHTASGLITELEAGTTLREAEEQVLAYVREHVKEPRKAPLAGNTVGTDRTFLARDMKELEGFLHYRVIDVSSIKELARQWFPRAYFAAPAKAGHHRALADIAESIDELRYYRRAVFVGDPGPETEAARAIAAEVAASSTLGRLEVSTES